MITRPQALLISPLMPDRRGTGAQQRAATLLEALEARSDVTLWLLRAGSVGATSEVFSGPIFSFPVGGPSAKRFGPTRIEHESRRAIMREFENEDLLAKAPFDLVMCFRLQSAVFLERAERTVGRLAKRRATDLDDVESILAGRLGAVRDRTLSQAARTLRLVRAAQRAEDRCLASHDLVLVASPQEEHALRKRGDAGRLALAPNAVPWPSNPVRRPSSAPVSLTFVGNFGYYPNVDGVVWFARQVLPKISRYAAADFRVNLVGFNSDRLPRALLTSRTLDASGAARSIEQTYRETDVVIAPIRVGSGTRIKILEAMSYGLPIVSTSVGAEGIEAVAGEHILIADSAVAFSRACARLISEPRLRQGLGLSARTLVRTKYLQESVVRTLTDTIWG